MKLIILLAVVVIMKPICFFLMRYDKMQARQGGKQIPERVLFLSAGHFGALCGVLAMHIYFHKTKHWDFKTFFPLMLVVQIGILGFVTKKWLLKIVRGMLRRRPSYSFERQEQWKPLLKNPSSPFTSYV